MILVLLFAGVGLCAGTTVTVNTQFTCTSKNETASVSVWLMEKDLDAEDGTPSMFDSDDLLDYKESRNGIVTVSGSEFEANGIEPYLRVLFECGKWNGIRTIALNPFPENSEISLPPQDLLEMEENEVIDGNDYLTVQHRPFLESLLP